MKLRKNGFKFMDRNNQSNGLKENIFERKQDKIMMVDTDIFFGNFTSGLQVKLAI